jgi:hypothetical protein
MVQKHLSSLPQIQDINWLDPNDPVLWNLMEFDGMFSDATLLVH